MLSAICHGMFSCTITIVIVSDKAMFVGFAVAVHVFFLESCL